MSQRINEPSSMNWETLPYAADLLQNKKILISDNHVIQKDAVVFPS